MSQEVSFSNAMCTAAASPHRPSIVQRPSARSSIACRQPSSPTITRGQGRCRSACSRTVMVSSTAMTLSQQPGDVLEASNQLRRQVDSRDKYDGEVREHRHVGGLRWRGRSARLAECNRVEPQEQAAEAYQNAEHEDRCQPRLAREGRAQHQKLAHEYSEWWKPRDGH